MANSKILIDTSIIIDFSKEISLEASQIYIALKINNNIIEFRDIFIAATAIEHNLPLATLNKKHFIKIEQLELLDY